MLGHPVCVGAGVVVAAGVELVAVRAAPVDAGDAEEPAAA